MTRLLQAQYSLLKGKVPKRTTLCSTPLLTATSSPFRVEPRKGEVCVCDNRAKLNVGNSECNSMITIRNDITNNCSADVNGIKFYFTCPFDRIWETSPAAVWVCGRQSISPPAHYVVGVLLSSFDVNGNHSICSSWEECDCEEGKETIVK